MRVTLRTVPAPFARFAIINLFSFRALRAIMKHAKAPFSSLGVLHQPAEVFAVPRRALFYCLLILILQVALIAIPDVIDRWVKVGRDLLNGVLWVAPKANNIARFGVSVTLTDIFIKANAK